MESYQSDTYTTLKGAKEQKSHAQELKVLLLRDLAMPGLLTAHRSEPRSVHPSALLESSQEDLSEGY